MGNICSKAGNKNQAIFSNNQRGDVKVDKGVLAIVSGGTVVIEKPASPNVSKVKTQMAASDPEKILRMHTQTESKVRITTSYDHTLHEPSNQFSPQMRKINNFYGGGYCKEDEFELVKKLVTAGDPISYEEFLNVVTDEELKRIALIGGAGYGKSTEMKKLAQKLLNGEGQEENKTVQQQFNMIHTINFKDMPNKDSTSLQDCLFENVVPDADDRKHLLEQVEKNQSKCVVLIDGLDQAPYDTKSEYRKVSHWEKASTGTLMYNLMSGNIFPDVKVVVSSREHAISTLPKKARPECVIALAGLKKEHAKSLFLDLVQDDEQSWENIELNLGDLLSVLVIPIYLIFTAVVYKHSKEKNEQLPAYVTGLLAKIISILPNSEHMQENIIEILRKLKKLAYDGLKDRRLSFDVEYLKKRDLTPEEVSDLLSKVPTENIITNRLLEKDYFYFFCHQSMEEFLAACYILEMSLVDFKSFTEHEFRHEFDHWSNVIQYLSGITLNHQIQLTQSPNEIPDMNEKQKILRDALRRPLTDDRSDLPVAYYMALHDSNDDELIRQLQKIVINRTSLTSHSTRAISSLMRRSESMERILLNLGGITDEILSLMTKNVKGSRFRIKDLSLLEEQWDVTCSALNSFLVNLEVNELTMLAFPTDYHQNFPNFEEKNLKLHFGSESDESTITYLKELCFVEKAEVTEG